MMQLLGSNNRHGNRNRILEVVLYTKRRGMIRAVTLSCDFFFGCEASDWGLLHAPDLQTFSAFWFHVFRAQFDCFHEKKDA